MQLANPQQPKPQYPTRVELSRLVGDEYCERYRHHRANQASKSLAVKYQLRLPRTNVIGRPQAPFRVTIASLKISSSWSKCDFYNCQKIDHKILNARFLEIVFSSLEHKQETTKYNFFQWLISRKPITSSDYWEAFCIKVTLRHLGYNIQGQSLLWLKPSSEKSMRE